MSRLTDAQADAYLEAPHKCPFCASTSIEGGHVEIDNGRAVQAISCCDCEREWRDIYKLHGIETDTEEEPPKNQIVITIEGGVIQDISGIPEGAEVVTLDYDTQGVDNDKLQPSPWVPEQACVLNRWPQNRPLQHYDFTQKKFTNP